MVMRGVVGEDLEGNDGHTVLLLVLALATALLRLLVRLIALFREVHEGILPRAFTNIF